MEKRLAWFAGEYIEDEFPPGSTYLESSLSILKKIGGVGMTQLINKELCSEAVPIRRRALSRAFLRPNGETIKLINTIAEEEQPDELYASEAQYAAAVMGNNSALIRLILKIGLWNPDSIRQVRSEAMPFTKQTIKKLYDRIEKAVDEDSIDHALSALWISGRSEIVPKLQNLLKEAKSKSIDRAYMIAYVLVGLDDGSVETTNVIRDCLEWSEDSHLRWLRLLCHIGTPEALDIAQQCLVSRGCPDFMSEELALMSYLATSSISRQEVLAPLIRSALKEVSADHWPAYCFKVLNLDDDDIREKLEEVSFRPKEVGTVLEGHLAAIRALSKYDKQASFQACCQALSLTRHRRELIPSVMIEIGPEEAVKFLTQHACKEPQAFVRWEIGRCLRNFKNPRLVRKEIQSLLHNPDSWLRGIGAELAGWQTSRVFIAELRKRALDGINELERMMAIEALQRQHREEEALKLMKMFKKVDEARRWALLEGIIKLADPNLLQTADDRLSLHRLLTKESIIYSQFVSDLLNKRRKGLEQEAKRLDGRTKSVRVFAM